jgi:hypothetical protein
MGLCTNSDHQAILSGKMACMGIEDHPGKIASFVKGEDFMKTD